MEAGVVGVIVLVCAFGGVLLGMWLRSLLPEHHFDAESRDTVKLGIGLIATMTALVLGLVTASAKRSFDDVDTAVRKTAVELLTLDRLLARYGPETGEIRRSLQRAVGERIERIWPRDGGVVQRLDPAGAPVVEALAAAMWALQPRDDTQRALQARAVDLAEGLLQVRWLTIAGTQTSVPVPFLTVLVLWLTFIFASFGALAPRNGVVVTVLLCCALSVASAVFLVLEMDSPFDGLLRVSADPLRSVHALLDR